MKIKTSELAGAALDWVVAKCEGRTLSRNPMGPQCGHGWWIWEEVPSGRGGILLGQSVYMGVGPRLGPKTWNSGERYSPSTDWSQGGPIIEREGITVASGGETAFTHQKWTAYKIDNLFNDDFAHENQNGPTALIAAMRCFVASKLGDEVDVPAELI